MRSGWFFYWIPKVQKVCKSCRSRQELSNEYLVFTCKIWCRYRRERASQSFPNFSQRFETKLEKNIGARPRRGRRAPGRPRGLRGGRRGGARGAAGCGPPRTAGGRAKLAGLLQDARYVIDTITFFAVSCPENPAFSEEIGKFSRIFQEKYCTF